MTDLRELYQDIILDHARHPRNFAANAQATHQAHGHNPLCGDTVTVYLKLDDQGRVTAANFQGHGCAISLASASLMTETVLGKTGAQIDELFADFQARVTGGKDTAPPPELADDAERLAALVGVKAYPSRVKCAVLPWHALQSALSGGESGGGA
ncbi:MAG: SUF system NifU family Fe-S cluster assembly protein [Candidatus Symbiobacter sp.]|nr:SUF system NifU family Fe-S cluster assembly protein [Candidatus Symbiobacter sp.]